MKFTRSMASPLLVVSLFVCSGWGFLVHRTTTQLAIYQLPKGLQPFFYANMKELVSSSVRPDQRRNEDKTEAPKHYINFELFGDSAAWKMPQSWQQAVVKYSEDSLEKYGYVPYWVIEMKSRLTLAFRSGNKDSILFQAADLAHYIQDAHVPLHTSHNHDGQLTGQKGMHSLWESLVPEIELTNYTLYSGHKARYLKDAEAAIWSRVRGAHLLLPDLFELERKASIGFTDSTKYRYQMRNGRESRSYSTAFAKAYSAQLGNTVNTQLLRSAEMVADFWYTAWVDAGKPSLTHLVAANTGKEAKKKLKEEKKQYKRNNLLKANLLLAKQTSGTE